MNDTELPFVDAGRDASRRPGSRLPDLLTFGVTPLELELYSWTMPNRQASRETRLANAP
jgi:hypothetical protein